MRRSRDRRDARRRIGRGAAALVIGAWLAGPILCGAASAATGDPDPSAVREALAARGLSDEEIDSLLAQRAAGAGTDALAAEARSMAGPGTEGGASPPDPARAILDESAGTDPYRPAEMSATPAPAAGLGDDRETMDALALAPPPSSVSTDGALPRFGASFFALPPDAFAPAAYGPVAPDYRLGPGDEIVLDVWGDTVFRHVETVNREGTVLLPDVGQVALQGMTLKRARQAVRDRLASAYSGLEKSPPTTFVDLTLGRLRTIRVFVAGDVVRPGGYDLSAASTVLHALWLAGGPSETGSMRAVRVVRGEEPVATLDLYRYFREGMRPTGTRLQHDDTIFVPVRRKLVTAAGEITRPGRYELVDGEGLADLVSMAGGPTGLTDVDRALVQRVLPPADRTPYREDRVVLDAPLSDVLAGRSSFPLEDLDALTFARVPDDRRDWVAVRGNVWSPSTFAFQEGMRVRDLVLRADSLREDSFTDWAILRRTRPDRTRESVSFDLGAAMSGDPAANLLLLPRDELVVLSRWDLHDRKTVSVFGAVRSPGAFELAEGMNLLELVLEAGGFVENAYSYSVEVSRVEPDARGEARIAQAFRVEAGDDFPRVPGLVAFELKNHDNVFVREIPFWELQRNVVIEGEVRFPGAYTLLSPTDRLSTIIDRAGGLLPTAFPRGFRLQRTHGDVGSVSVDFDRALSDPEAEENLILFDGDRLIVPERPMTVKIVGAVNHPTSLVYRAGKGIGYYIENSGGFSDRAKKRDVTIVYSTGRAAKVRRFRRDPGVEPGARIVVPARGEDEGTDWGAIIKDTTTILASLATTYLVIDRVSE